MNFKKIIIITGLFLGLVVFNIPSYSETIYPNTIKTPFDLSEWLIDEFKYVKEKPGQDVWKTPRQTILDRNGDCEDYALLSCYVLNQLGYQCELLGIQWNNRISGHAIAIFKDVDGYLSVFDVGWYFRIQGKDIYDVLDVIYPDWYEAQTVIKNTKYIKHRYYNDKK